MNTAMVTPALDMFASKPTSVSANKPKDSNEAPRFSEVLSKQHTSQQTSSGQPKTAQSSTKKQETTENNIDNPDANHLAPEDETNVAQGPIGVLPTENLLINTAVQFKGGDARLVPAAAAAPAQKPKIAEPALRFSTTAPLAKSTQTASTTESTLAKQIGTVISTMMQPETETTRSTHQTNNPDTKNKSGVNKAGLVAITTYGNKPTSDPIKAKVAEFSTAMIDSATLAQSRFAAKNGPDTLVSSLSDTAVPPHPLTTSSGATLLSAGQLATLHGTAATPLSNPQWANDFGRQVVSFTQNSNNGLQVAELRLDPPELGPIRITLNLNDNVANAAFFSPHAIVRQTVENALPQLQELLAQAGISLGEASVSDQGQTGNQAANESSTSATNNRNNTTNASVLTPGGAMTDTTTPTRSRDPDALVDIFA